MQNVAVLNTTGVSFLASGDHSAAAEAFKQALIVLRDACNTIASTKLVASGPDDAHLTLSGYNAGYGQALLIQSLEGDTTYESYTICSAVVMYNLGMTIQYKGYLNVNQHHHGELPFCKASVFYKKSLQLLSTLPDSLEKSQIAALALANLGDVSYFLGDFQGQRCALDSLFFLKLRHQLQEQESEHQEESIAPAA